MIVTTPNRQGKVALFFGVAFCAITVVLTGYIFANGLHSFKDRQWSLILLAFPVLIHLYLNRAVIVNHLRNRWYVWALTAASCFVIGLQVNLAQDKASHSITERLRTYFFSWVEEPPSNSALTFLQGETGDDENVPFQVVSDQAPSYPFQFYQSHATWKFLPTNGEALPTPLRLSRKILYHALYERY